MSLITNFFRNRSLRIDDRVCGVRPHLSGRALSDARRKGFHSDCDSDDRCTSRSVSCSNFPIIGEFDPGSGRTLAACLTHVSRTGPGATPVQWQTGA